MFVYDSQKFHHTILLLKGYHILFDISIDQDPKATFVLGIQFLPKRTILTSHQKTHTIPKHPIQRSRTHESTHQTIP